MSAAGVCAARTTGELVLHRNVETAVAAGEAPHVQGADPGDLSLPDQLVWHDAGLGLDARVTEPTRGLDTNNETPAGIVRSHSHACEGCT